MTIRLKHLDTYVSINPFGAELVEFQSKGKNYIWTIDEQFWNKTSPVLFPIVGRLKNDIYTLSCKQYSLPRHGFARNYEFEVLQKSESSVTFSLKENEKTLLEYPFRFELILEYTLSNNTLEIKYTVRNNSEGEMPFSIGAHPAFKIGSHFEDYGLLFENDHVLISHELENENFSGKTYPIKLQNGSLPLSYSYFEKDAIVLKQFNSKKITILKNNIPYLAVTVDGFPNLGVWTKPDAPFLCIEPWNGFADNANTSGDIFKKEGITILKKEEEFTASITISIL
ncbi:aldose 1-epimerase family protein [Flavobacterium amniphilum]|uniref:aldose 1-epimerase family protein n=1 Tax=Flavobacterium amniphilum TaxID=1834035 RepID=UPI00202A2478|nr:aldose 1-epimerase family protein [Flavobacterium amniphilum]MCL9807555.1 aldose 1-epimerase family protein [Flavobacterium amniphilum]